MTFKSNYSSTFTVWDRVFGTDIKVRVRSCGTCLSILISTCVCFCFAPLILGSCCECGCECRCLCLLRSLIFSFSIESTWLRRPRRWNEQCGSLHGEPALRLSRVGRDRSQWRAVDLQLHLSDQTSVAVGNARHRRALVSQRTERGSIVLVSQHLRAVVRSHCASSAFLACTKPSFASSVIGRRLRVPLPCLTVTAA